MKHTVIILAAKNQLSLTNYSSQMAPIHGKPAIGWVIDSYISQDIILIINKNNKKLETYIQCNYPKIRMITLDFRMVQTEYKQYSILTSLQYGLNNLKDNIQSVSIVLGDTYCKYIQTEPSDSVLVSPAVASSEKWCLVSTNSKNEIEEVFDKEFHIPINSKKALIGVYNFSDVFFLKKVTSQALQYGCSKISDVLKLYNERHKIQCIENTSWIDLGHKAGIIKAQKEFYNSRNFNTLASDDIKCTITKKSTNTQKLADEYYWYLNVPQELQSFTPRVFSGMISEGMYELTMEKYGYPPLSELWIFGDFDLEEWQLILEYLCKLRKHMDSFSGNLNYNDFYDLYVTKLSNRLAILKKSNSYWADLMQLNTIKINDKEYKNLNYFYEQLIEDCIKLAKTAHTCVMHGDFCFSNILFDTQNFICKLIDPRGRLTEKTIFGDSRYDIAKLRHSLVGGYDYVVHKLYNFSEKQTGFYYNDLMSPMQKELKTYFDNLIVRYGYNLQEIKLIETCLFLSMIPLHDENIEKQKIFYIKGIIKLNEYFERRNYA
nr:hypothetical protein [uncultured Treponema sp.]